MGLHAVALGSQGKEHKEQQNWQLAQVRQCSIKHTVSDTIQNVRSNADDELTWQRPARHCPMLQGQIADGRRA